MQIRFFMFLIIMEILSFCDGYLFIQQIEVHDSKENGKPWDSFNGAPDVECYVFIFSEGIWKKKYSSAKYSDLTQIKDVLETQIFVDLQSKIKVEIVDVDLSGNDVIGTVDITLSAKDFTGEAQEISFGRVAKFYYYILPHKTMQAQKHSDLVAEEIEKYKREMDEEIKNYKQKIHSLEKIIEEQKSILERYIKKIQLLEKEIKKNPVKKEEEFWNEFEKDLKK